MAQCKRFFSLSKTGCLELRALWGKAGNSNHASSLPCIICPKTARNCRGLSLKNQFLFMCTYLCVHIYVYIFMCTYLCVHIYVYILMCTYLCVHMYIYVYVYTSYIGGSPLPPFSQVPFRRELKLRADQPVAISSCGSVKTPRKQPWLHTSPLCW